MWPHRIPLKKAYESTAYITWPENTVCQLILAASNSLESAEKSYGQVWLAQARLPEDFKKTLRDLSIVPGHLFGPDVSEVLEKRMKLSATTQQLTQVQRTPNFRMPIPPAHRRYTPAQPRFWQPSSRPQGQQRFPGSDEAQIRHPRGGQSPTVLQGVHVNAPPQLQKAGTSRPETLGPAVGCFTTHHLNYWESIVSDPWVLATVRNGYTLQFHCRPPKFSGLIPTVVTDPIHSAALSLSQKKKNSFLVGEESDREGSPLSSKRGFYSAYFLVPKRDGGFCPILDLRRLNKFLKKLLFRMLRVTDVLRSVAERDWFTSVELTDAYFHVPIAMHHRKFLCFSFKNKLSVQSSIIWPLTSPSCVYEMYEGCPVSPVGPRSANSTISGRLAALSSDEGPICAQYTATTRPFGQVGSLSEQGKELSVPCTIHHVHRDDYRFNLNACLSVSDDRYSKPSCPVSSGSVSTVWSVPEASRDANSSLLHNSPGITPSATPASMEQPSAVGFISSSASAGYSDSQLRACPPQVGFPNLLTAGVPLGIVPSGRKVVTTDATLMGWGAVWNHRGISGRWSRDQSMDHINLLEMRAVFLALSRSICPPTCLFDQTIRQPFSIWIIRGVRSRRVCCGSLARSSPGHSHGLRRWGLLICQG